jgi:hypothetical protein
VRKEDIDKLIEQRKNSVTPEECEDTKEYFAALERNGLDFAMGNNMTLKELIAFIDESGRV